MNSRNLLNIILALVMIALIILVIYEPGKETPPPVSTLTTFNKADINTVIIEQPKQTKIVLQKINGHWQMQEPIAVPGNKNLIENLLAIVGTTTHASYPVTEIDKDKLQLSTPSLLIQLNNTRLIFGGTDALHGYRYILTGDRVYLVTDRFSHLVRGKPAALISTSPLPENISITRLALPKITLLKNQDGWTTEPGDHSGSADQVQKLLDKWRYATALQVSMVEQSSISTDNHHNPLIVVQAANNERYQFRLVQDDDEMMLIRTDLGVSYHFTTEVGNKMLDLQYSQQTNEATQ